MRAAVCANKGHELFCCVALIQIPTLGRTDLAQGFRDIVLRLHMDGDQVRAGGDELRQIEVRPGNHQVDIEEDVVRLMHRLDDGRAEGNVFHEMPVHHVQMHPVRAGVDRAADFVADAGKIGRQQRRGDDAVMEIFRNHRADTNHGSTRQARKNFRGG